MEIDLFVDPTRPRQTSATLFDQIRDAITTARLAPGDRLPTSRDLAAELGVARSTIATVYAHLIGEGFVEARTGDGTYVAHHPASTPPRRRAAPTALTPRRAVAPPPQPAVISDVRIDLRTGRPDPQLFPLVDWRRCVTTALQSPPPGYGDPAGLPALRRALAAWIRRSRGVVAEPEQVLVTAGAQQSFDLLSRVLLAPGDTIAIEEPGYAPARRVFEHNGLRVAPVPVDSDGIVVEAIPSSARAVYVTPSHQLPTGVTMTAARRRALLALAHQRSLAIIEDDYDTEYRHVDRPLEPLQLLDTAGRVLVTSGMWPWWTVTAAPMACWSSPIRATRPVIQRSCSASPYRTSQFSVKRSASSSHRLVSTNRKYLALMRLISSIATSVSKFISKAPNARTVASRDARPSPSPADPSGLCSAATAG